ncbi:uncharacterized protein CDAR_300841 [Caerostris darwini]|uniref:Uncharacterized protein n=1 Tax=Caerostris darwini TaxID=1538125 RepID=A0AAV4WAB6_9ARAC|nr:uncharacterized protein CDAR_300841 [Caerostris darwini]
MEVTSRVESFFFETLKKSFLSYDKNNSVLRSCVGHFVGKKLLRWRVVTFQKYKPKVSQEDPGVLEMRAMLRGEDCFDYNLDQSQRRSSLPIDFNPYEEIYLVKLHFKILNIIQLMLISMKDHEEPFAQTFNTLFKWFDSLVVGYLKSQVYVNKRD